MHDSQKRDRSANARSPPLCLSCALNGYDASLYDLPGPFGQVEASIGF